MKEYFEPNDLSIEARISEKKTGRAITYKDDVNTWYPYFSVCFWRKCYPVAFGLFELCETITGHGSTESKWYETEIPAEKLREIYEFLIQESFLKEIEKTDSEHRNDMREWRMLQEAHANALNASRLLEVILFLFEGNIASPYEKLKKSLMEHIASKNDFRALLAHPEEYEWDFKLLALD
ncbi:MAG: hypothetical protein IJ644_11065 [Oscillospiraceae bacterium]|nr:hypothetical protein [Oscillospiraceae bacterium]